MTESLTRLEIETALTEHIGQGKSAMRAAITSLMDKYPEMDPGQKDRILDDLLSYAIYAQEEKE